MKERTKEITEERERKDITKTGCGREGRRMWRSGSEEENEVREGVRINKTHCSLELILNKREEI